MLTTCVTFSFCASLQEEKNPFSPTSTDFSVWGPHLVNDSITPDTDDIARFRSQIDMVFTGKVAEFPSLRLIRQDYDRLEYNKTCLGNALKIGSQSFEKGLGTHANSEIEVSFSEPVVRFSAMVGIDRSRGTNGSVRFIVCAFDKELLRTPILRGGDEAYTIDLTLPEGTTKLQLVVDATEDGPAHDHASWCNPVVVGKSGKTYDLTTTSVSFMAQESVPFSFDYNGVSSREFLRSWQFEKKDKNSQGTVYSWTDPVSGLKVEADVRWFEQFAAADWVLHFTNTGTQNTPRIENVRTLDLSVNLGSGNSSSNMIHTINGDQYSRNSWLPAKYPLKNGEGRHFAPVGGRSSNGMAPVWNLQSGDVGGNEVSGGMFVMIGWSGQWAADFMKKNDSDVHISAGMEKIATILYPGESIRQPRILVMPWNSSRINSQVLFRRLLMFEYVPKPDQNFPVKMPISSNCWTRYFGKNQDWATHEGQVAWAKIMREAGIDHLWLDALWFPGQFPVVGNWYSDTTRFPEGIEALGKELREMGMKLIVWFEPERAAEGSQIAKDHPQYLFEGTDPWLGGSLFKINDPEARKYMTDLLHDRIVRYGIDVLRIDFNMDPLGFWRANDSPERLGMTEIRYVEGHYEMWNQLIKDNPGLWIDNCASGGRRIDLETIAISVPVWRSDLFDFPDTRPEWIQMQTMSFFQFIPLSSCSTWESAPYHFRSSASPGALGEFNFMDGDYDAEKVKAAYSEAKVYQKFWYGDFYPLTEVNAGDINRNDLLLAWQLHREDLNAGVVYVFRHGDCPFLGRELSLHAIDRDATYEVTLKRDYSAGTTTIFSGKQLSEFQAEMPQKQSSLLIEYRKIGNRK
ncbi:MAG: NPCBM/NEW2 domain-containing protein [Planctomycetaceae bacterium]|nr:NPCBM/NEW2 domain-containing protein [Planctomycetaceae bacterium]